ncbi:MAG: DUF4199 domain-containing protein [Flavobacteriaceae bacterium]|nr:DUF4199 domain-containing protein [Flavobacteriaceae bacterium]
MENQQNPSRKSIMLNYGLYLGIASILLSVLNYSFGNTYEPHWSLNVLGIVLLIVFAVLGIKKFKEANGGLLSIGQALKTGIGITILGAIIFMVYFYVFAKFIEPEFIARTTELNLEKALERNPSISQEALDAQENATKKYFFAFSFGFILIVNLFIGFVVSLIAGLVMQKKEEY